jgi:hypothetical protein
MTAAGCRWRRRHRRASPSARRAAACRRAQARAAAPAATGRRPRPFGPASAHPMGAGSDRDRMLLNVESTMKLDALLLGRSSRRLPTTRSRHAARCGSPRNLRLMRPANRQRAGVSRDCSRQGRECGGQWQKEDAGAASAVGLMPTSEVEHARPPGARLGTRTYAPRWRATQCAVSTCSNRATIGRPFHSQAARRLEASCHNRAAFWAIRRRMGRDSVPSNGRQVRATRRREEVVDCRRRSRIEPVPSDVPTMQ